MTKYNSGPPNVPRFLDFPEADVLFTARNKARIVNRTELNALNIEFGSLLRENLRFDSLTANF
jgi:hypothetical protein